MTQLAMSWIPLVERPATTPLAVAVVLVAVGWAAHVWQRWATRPARPVATGSVRPVAVEGRPPEPPAVVALLTNEFEVPASAVTATLLDLAAQGWVRLTVANGELIVVARPATDTLNALSPFEQQVFNHARARAFNDVTSANTLAASRDRLDRSWRQRFARAIGERAQHDGLTVARYPTLRWAPVAAAASLAGVALLWSWQSATDVDIQDGWRARLIWLFALVGASALGVATNHRVRSAAQTPTPAGLQRAGEWLGYRTRLQARIPMNASVIGAPDQQRALATAVAMGVATYVHQELPVAPDDPRRAWSDAGDAARTVRVRYPFRPGYGQHPVKVLAVGVVSAVAIGLLRNFLRDVAAGEALASLLDNSPGQVDLFRDVASVLATLCLIPMAGALWAVIAGFVDSVITRERVGVVVRTRHPADVLPLSVSSLVNPFGGRAALSMYLAVDDGTRHTVNAWVADGRSIAPEGAQARVRATPLLGFVRSSEPVGTSTR